MIANPFRHRHCLERVVPGAPNRMAKQVEGLLLVRFFQVDSTDPSEIT